MASLTAVHRYRYLMELCVCFIYGIMGFFIIKHQEQHLQIFEQFYSI